MKPRAEVKTLLYIMLGLAGAAAAAHGATFPFDGVVTGDGVKVRSGPDLIWYPVTKLMKGNTVQVVSEEYGWYEIKPPAGVYSWVRKDGVEKLDGGTGRVTSEKPVAVYAASEDQSEKRAVQKLLAKGDEVQIKGEKGDWYKIIPPDGATLWISADYVVPKGAVPVTKAPPIELTEPGEPAPPSPKPAATQPAATQAAATQPAEPEPDLPPQFKETFAKYAVRIDKLEKLFSAEINKPLLQQDWSALLPKWEEIAQQTDAPNAARYAKLRIAHIEDRIKRQQDYQRMQLLVRDAMKLQTETREKIAKIDTKTLENKPRFWQAEGLLRESLVFTGPNMPKRYSLYNPTEQRIIAYVEVAEGAKLDLDSFLGRYVLVTGKVYYDPANRIDIVQAEKVDLRPASASAPAGSKE